LRITPLQFRVLAIFVLSLSFFKGIRLPTRFALTQYLFTYEEGFIRRGLWGSLFEPFQPHGYWELAGLAFGLLAIFILVMWRLLSQDARSGVPSALPWLAFLASPGLVFFFHIVGSLDYVAFIAVWALILASSRIGSTATQGICFLLSPILLLVHEAAIVMAIPSLFFLIMTANEHSDERAIRRVAAFSVLTFATLALLVQTGSLQASERQSVIASVSHRATFEVRRDAIGTLFHRTSERVALMNKINSGKKRQKTMASSLVLFMPVTFFFFWLSLRQCRTQARARRWVTTLAIVGVGLAPLILHFVAYDHHRWNALTNLSSFTTWLVMTRRSETDEVQPTSTVYAVAALVLILSLSSTNYFFADLHPQYFPEYDHLGTLKSWGDDAAIP